ncbi:MAG: Mur ligase domain-containing protein, partial [Vicinamibacteria bacterium]
MKIHICGVCGTATASLAGLLKAKGHQVTGSDQDVYPPMSDELARMGVPVTSPYAEANLPADVELVVIGNALSRGNPEVEAVLDSKRRYTSEAALLADEFLRDRTSM